MTLRVDTTEAYVGDIVELIHIDLSPLGGTDMYISPSGMNVKWNGNDYIGVPVTLSGSRVDIKSAPARVTMSVAADRSTMLINLINSYGDMVGAKVTYTWTFSKYLDNGETPDTSQYAPIERYIIIQKQSFNINGVSFLLASPLDLPTLKLPRRQILRDDNGGKNLYAPGVGRSR